jgi:hypothetical protein
MAASDDPGFQMPPTRIGRPGGRGGGRRPGRARLILVVLAALVIPAVAFAGPRIEWRPSIDLSALVPSPPPEKPATPTPTVAPLPTATPLPSLTIATGPLPTGPLPIHAGGFHLLDPATGALSAADGISLDNDVVFREPGGDGWWCVCFRQDQQQYTGTVDVTVRHLDRNLTEAGTFAIATYESATPPPAQDFGVRFDLERSSDGRTAYLALGQRSAAGWTIKVDVIDLEHGGLINSQPLTTIDIPPPPEPAPSITDFLVESYLGGPSIRLSPDGRRFIVTATADTVDPASSASRSESFGWLAAVPEDPSTEPILDIRPLEGALFDWLGSCSWLTWMGPEELVMTCGEAGASGHSKVTVRTVDLAGRQTGAASFEYGNEIHVAEPLIDAANRLAYFWEPGPHILHRLDLGTGTAVEIDVHPARGATTAIATPIPSIGPLTNLPPVWIGVYSDYTLYSAPQLVAEPGGTRLYALGTIAGQLDGYGGGGSGSTGVWVFDTRTFANVDHWPAAASYVALGITRDGRWLEATGAPGMDVDGNPSGWEASLTIHDTVDGRVALQLGNLGDWPVLTLP